MLNKKYEIDFYKINDYLNNIKIKNNKKFLESIDLTLNIYRKKSNIIYGNCDLPNSNCKKICIGVFSLCKDIDYLKKIGADFVGTNDLVDIVNNKKNKVDILFASNESIILLKEFIKNIKYKNIIPNKDNGTIISDFNIINKLKNGYKVFYKSDKNGVLNVSLGKINFNNNLIIENIVSFLKHIYSYKIYNNKNFYIRSIYLSSTMGKSLKIK